jgi:hypothetical protein
MGFLKKTVTFLAGQECSDDEIIDQVIHRKRLKGEMCFESEEDCNRYMASLRRKIRSRIEHFKRKKSAQLNSSSHTEEL